MYNTKYVCTYTLSDDDCELYRTDLLNIFYLNEFDINAINLAISKLYTKIKDCIFVKECITKVFEKYGYEDEMLNFMLLLSFDYLCLTHKCICEHLENDGIISETNINELKKLIF